jgi:hypothetical protein
MVVGSPDAKVLVTAHYDTPGKNGYVFFLQPLMGFTIGIIVFTILLVGIFYAMPAFTFWLSSGFDIPNIIRNWIGVFVFWLVINSFWFIRNKNNHNDNTSGVLGVFDIAARVADNPEMREKVTFVLFDHEEIFIPGLSFGCLGSRSFSNWRKQNFPNTDSYRVINLDCIGNANVLGVITKKKGSVNDDIFGFLKDKGLNVKQVYEGGADHSSFEQGISLIYQKRSLFGPLYIPNMHTRRDKVCDLAQIERLGEAVYQYIGGKN